MAERWKVVPGWPLYDVSDKGRVRSRNRPGPTLKRHTPRMLTPKTSTGYPIVGLSDRNGNCKDIHVHRLVLLAFVGPCPDGMECAHRDSNPMNPALKNLRWATKQENEADKLRNGTSNRGERHGCNKLTEAAARYILKHTNAKRTVLARRFGVTRETVRDIQRRKIWAWLT